MKEFFSIGEAAKSVHTTTETLRHYDRIGLVKPSKKDDRTGYRYYTNHDIVLLNTIRALQQMELPLQKIKEVLEYDDLEKIVAFLSEAEKRADEKIAAIEYSKSKILAAKQAYINKIQGHSSADNIVITGFPERVILLSDTLEVPTLDNLWNYLRHFYDKIPESQREQFVFEDMAGIYTEHQQSNLFALCICYSDTDGLKVLPGGKYLCADCTEEGKEARIQELLRVAAEEYHVKPEFIVQQIILSGILQWKYQVQVYIGP